MFDIGWSELVVIAVVALIAIGPKELPGDTPGLLPFAQTMIALKNLEIIALNLAEERVVN